MKILVYAITVILFASCSTNSNKSINKPPKNIEQPVYSKMKLITFNGNNFNVGYPNSWTLNQREMSNKSSVAHFTANYKIANNRAITFQIINLLDTASLKTGVEHLIARYSKNPVYTPLKTFEINKNVFINTRIKFTNDVSSESYFLKNGENLFWLTFMGDVADLDKHNSEFRAMVESFELNNSVDNQEQ
nr:hypothetical protein [uncultured Carboxylicivirga sp.]